ncbi:release factor H-coupled R [Lindgomyces ingoldianus]|uniref:Release factor H-coupled R n=1 Tax=Lindgomyces ingoldianus TaxID=673940 RepID=A0ACB6Q895_9PLEO|nr:release factor H-coupled R [Lindgomyces ingoldianus]KAF2463183.1 release factor H-coupled R [Lindgomyces ingoldianus]
MPATRVTVALNAKQSQKAPLLIPTSASHDPSSAASICSLVFKTAQSKLRLRKPSRVYVAGTGQELITSDDWKSVIRDDLTLLVSAGEMYIGMRKESTKHPDANPDCLVNILAEKAPVDKLSVTQLQTIATELPGIVHAVGQPDLHPGTKFPIGAVFASRKWVHPPLIGSDIGCGMAWYKTNLSRRQVDGDKGKKVAEKLRGLEGPWRTQADREQWLLDDGCSAGEEWDSSLGTIGAGNHFAEIQVVETLSLPNGSHGLHENDVVLLVHSGSRGYGGNILKKYTSEAHVSLEEDNNATKEYMREHDQACRWAKANRDLIAVRFLSCLEPGEEVWGLGQNPPNAEQIDDTDMISLTKAKLQERRVVDILHNNVERVKWPPAPPSSAATISALKEKDSQLLLESSQEQQDYVYIHRKGAAPTCNPVTNMPLDILPLPGSRGTPTMILKPTFSEETSWGMKNALSLAHGAGRSISRSKALSSFSQKYKNHNLLLEPGTGPNKGTWVICDEKDLVYEEAPEAYKDVYAVSEDLVKEGVAEIVGLCRARISYKVRNELR